MSVESAVVLAQDLYLLRRYDEALEVLRKVVDQDPDYPIAYWTLAMVHLAKAQPKEAVAAAEKGRRASPLDWITELLAAAHAADGNRAEAQKILNELDERSKRGGYVSAYYLAYAYLALNDRERALAALEKDYEQRSPI